MLDRATIEDFLYHEADLLDERRWVEWFELFTDDATYWVPASPGQRDPINEISLIYDDIAMLQARAGRMGHPAHHANTPVVRGHHHVSNVRVRGIDGDECSVESRLLLIDVRDDRRRLFSARVEHRLRLVGPALRIVHKKVVLIDADLPQEELVVPF